MTDKIKAGVIADLNSGGNHEKGVPVKGDVYCVNLKFVGTAIMKVLTTKEPKLNREHKMIKCGCNKGPCEGECRKLHLNRARKPIPTKGFPGGKIPRCPAAYEDSVSKKKKDN